MTGSDLAVAAADLTLMTPRGTVYENIDVAAPAGALVAFTGPAGSGRTALLLTLAGRMRHTSGRAQICGLPLPRAAAAVRRRVGLGETSRVNDIDAALSVGAVMHAELLLAGRPAAARDIAATLAVAGLDPYPATRIDSLDVPDRFALGVALGLAGHPDVLAVDDAGLGCTPAERRAVWALLRDIADSGVTVLAATPDSGGCGADICVEVGTDAVA